MHNHFHIALYLDPKAPLQWEPEEVAQRWLTVFPGLLNGANTEEEQAEVIRTLAENQDRISELRLRLGNLGWFMRSISQPVARRANIEDECTGRFWEGRFKVQALLDERAALSCMTYIDLNPIRAKICNTLAECAHTSIKARLRDHRRQIEANGSAREKRIAPVFDGLGPQTGNVLSITAIKYIELTQWTGEQLWPSKGGHLLPSLAAGNDASLSDKQKAWLRQVKATESAYARAIGSVEALLRKARNMNQAWLKGIRFARTMPTPQASP